MWMSPTTALLMVGILGLTGHCLPNSYNVWIDGNGVVTETRDIINEDGTHQIITKTYPNSSSGRQMTPEEKVAFDKDMEKMKNDMESMKNDLETSSRNFKESMKESMDSLRKDMESMRNNMRNNFHL